MRTASGEYDFLAEAAPLRADAASRAVPQSRAALREVHERTLRVLMTGHHALARAARNGAMAISQPVLESISEPVRPHERGRFIGLLELAREEGILHSCQGWRAACRLGR